MSGCLVSVVIPVRDAGATICRAVASVLAQDYRPIEIIVIDDGSRDRMADAAPILTDPAVRVVRLAQSRGAAAARNLGIYLSAGDIVAFQDADDEWLPEKLARQVDLLRSDPRLVLVACGASFWSPAGEELGLLFDGQAPPAGSGAWCSLLARNTIATPTVVTWRRHLLAAGGFDERLTVAEDQDLWIRLAMRGDIAYLNAPLVRVHATEGSLSSVGSADSFRLQLEFTLPMIERHVEARRAELSQRDIRKIFGERWGRLGRAGYSLGHYSAGLRLIVRAAWLGFEPLRSLRFLASATPPLRWLKACRGGRRRGPPRRLRSKIAGWF
jgi:glycosyltransferase involved in cell wall biosynthesis